MWQCPKCKREFQKTNQIHSCVSFPLEKHFEGKEEAKELFEFLKSQIEKQVGPVKIESLPCCIHFVHKTTFCACWAVKGKIRIDFSLANEKRLERAVKTVKLSANRFIYYIEIVDNVEIDSELLGWIKESYNFIM